MMQFFRQLIARAGRRASPDDPQSDGAATPPLHRVESTAARAAHRTNPHTSWASRARAANDSDRSLACHRIWQALPDLHIRPKFRVAAGDAVFATGSCFAREVEDALDELGIDVPSRCDSLFETYPLEHDLQKSPGIRPRSYLNRYNSMSMLEEFRHLLGASPALDAGLLIYPLDNACVADLHYSQSLKQVDMETTLARRHRVREYLGPLVRQCKTYVITLGMAECWFDEKAGCYLNNTPGPRVLAAFGDQLSVHLTRFEQHLRALEELYKTLYRIHGSDFRIIVTVSPVPLERSFLPQDVVVTNTYSKAMLRAVAEEFTAFHENADYFPSFELVSFADPHSAWAWDHRHVNPDLVRHIMTLFRTHYISTEPIDHAAVGVE
ncbi:MAG: GSCFA domain-containing protein [Pseudomonadales bacterium]|nr:GSCFA domain-containing protein [Pseudomonadales bacterium]